MKTLTLISTLLLSAALVFAQEATTEEAEVDYASFDKDVLVVLCQQQQAKIKSLEERIEKLEQQIGQQAGADEGDVAVDGETVIMPAGSWVVTIVSNPKPDTKQLEDQIKSEESKLPDAESRISKEKKAFSQLLERRSYTDVRGVNHRGYTQQEKDNAQTNVTMAERDRQQIVNRIAQLRRQIDMVNARRVIVGTTDDGKSARITAAGIYLALADTLLEGETYNIQGSGHVGTGSVSINLKGAAPIVAPAQVADNP